METLWQDSRYAVRMMRRSPGFTSVALLSLALGIGANTAIFSLINTLMLRSLPVREPQRLVELLGLYPGDPRLNFFSWKHYERFRDQNHVFSDLIGVSPSRFQLAAEGLEPETVSGAYVMGTFFPVLGMQPAIGRLLGLALSRIRELDADATALELTGDLAALIAALDKLERHHAGSAVRRADASENDPTRLLRSHPATSERVGTLRGLAH